MRIARDLLHAWPSTRLVVPGLADSLLDTVLCKRDGNIVLFGG